LLPAIGDQPSAISFFLLTADSWVLKAGLETQVLCP
jgi:hypothetical protein